MDTTLSLNIIMSTCMYPSIFILYFAMAFDVKASNGTLFGIRYRSDWLPDEEVHALEKDYFRRIRKCLLIFMVIPFSAYLTPYMSISITIWCTWLLAAIVAFTLQSARSYKHLLELKQERNRPEDTPETVYFELKGAQIRCVRWRDLLAPLLISCLAAVFPFLFFQEGKRESFGVLMIIIAVTNLFLCACALWMDRLKVNVISSNSDVNINYARARKKLWKQFWMASIWASIIYTVIILLYPMTPLYKEDLAFHIIFWGSLATCLAMLALCIYVIIRKRKLDELYYGKMDIITENEEKYWIGGFLYYNPHDRHNFVDKKFGIGTTMNMARPAGKIITAIGGLALLIIPVTCIWLMLEEFTPLSLVVQGDVLKARHLVQEYAIPLDSIEEVTLLSELPKSRKVHGTNSSVLEKGVFKNSTDGRVEEFLNPQNQVFLRIQTDGAIYYMSGCSDEKTLEIYHLLSEQAGSCP